MLNVLIGGGSVMLQAMAYGGTVGDELYDGVWLSLSAWLLDMRLTELDLPRQSLSTSAI